jgi:hypothetical protein
MVSGEGTVSHAGAVEKSFFSNLYPTSQRNEWRMTVMNGHGRPCEILQFTGDYVENC